MAQSDVLVPADDLENIRKLSGNDLLSKFQGICSGHQLPDSDFMATLSTPQREIVYKCYLLLYAVTNGKKLPRQFQLEATLALLAGKDSLIHAATGSGKTLCMVLPALLEPTAVSLVISPLKRLQALQVSVVNDIMVRF
jgi:ATP-dependent helicase YprA (DUF1998 family)